MRDLDANSRVWRRRGSSLVWDKYLLGSLLGQSTPLPLREVMQYVDGEIPSSPPSQGPILVSGLQTCLEVLDPRTAFSFLRQRVQRLVRLAQDQWPGHALVFCMTCTWEHWKIDVNDYAFLKNRSGHDISVTYGLWNGVASEAQRLVVERDGRITYGGFYVSRFS